MHIWLFILAQTLTQPVVYPGAAAAEVTCGPWTWEHGAPASRGPTHEARADGA